MCAAYSVRKQKSKASRFASRNVQSWTGMMKAFQRSRGHGFSISRDWIAGVVVKMGKRGYSESHKQRWQRHLNDHLSYQ